MSKILLLTGPGGSGKSTIATMLSRKIGSVYVNGDQEDTEFFPDGNQWLPENTELLQKAHVKILQTTKKLADQGNNVVVDYIIFGRYREFIASFQKEFGDDFSVVILLPSIDEIIERDHERECWTTGPERIKAVYHEFEALRDVIGTENYLDTSGQTPEETVMHLLPVGEPSTA